MKEACEQGSVTAPKPDNPMTSLSQQYQVARNNSERNDPLRVLITALHNRPRNANAKIIEFTPSELAEEMNRLAADQKIDYSGTSFTNAKRVGILLSQLGLRRGRRTTTYRTWQISSAELEIIAQCYHLPDAGDHESAVSVANPDGLTGQQQLAGSETPATALQVGDILVMPTPDGEKTLRKIAVMDPAMINKVTALAKRTREFVVKGLWVDETATMGLKETNELVQILQDESTSPVELLVAESVVGAFLRLCAAQQYASVAFQKHSSGSTIDALNKRVDSAQKAFLQAVSAHVNIRRRQAATKPSLQFSIARQQVNILNRTSGS
jgi:hypothetical protein